MSALVSFLELEKRSVGSGVGGDGNKNNSGILYIIVYSHELIFQCNGLSGKSVNKPFVPELNFLSCLL